MYYCCRCDSRLGLTCNAQTPVDSTNVEETDTTIQNDDLQGGITRGE